VCQPIINLQVGFTYNAGMLLRWNHTVYGLVDTKEFIALTEVSGAITIIGEWVFSEALKAITILRSECSSEPQISINGPPLKLRDSQNHIG